MNKTLNNCKIIQLQKIHNRSGNITIAENLSEIPFEIKRVYFLYDIPGGAERGGHAHMNLQQFIVAASGSFDVVIEDGKNKKTLRLDRPDSGLLITSGIWREIKNFSSGAICLVLASEEFLESDYIREYNDFLKFAGD